MAQPEQHAREEIDRLLQAAGWRVCDLAEANIHAARGVALREFSLETGFGFADYLLYVDGKAAGIIEAKKQGATLSGVEFQSSRYAAGLPASLPAWRRPLPFLYESTGIETHFTNGLDPEPRARPVFAFHTPEMLGEWLCYLGTAPSSMAAAEPAPTFLARMRHLPMLIEDGLWPAQVTAVKNLEASLAANKPRALIQMATGSGKTFTAISFIYRLIKFAGARRVLFLVDRGNLGRQTKKEFDQYLSPYNNFKFGEEYIVQHLTSNKLDKSARVVIIERDDFWATTSNKQLNFVQHIKTLLDIHGRAAVVVPDNVLFEGGAGETIRRKLLHECEVHTLLRLPTGLFYAQGVKANVIFFDKKPASESPWTRKLWIYDLRTNQHFTLKTNPMGVDDLCEFVALYNPAKRNERTPTWSPENLDGRWRAYDYEELAARDKASLDIFWLRDEALVDSDNLPAPEIIAQEIVDDLAAALEQFREVLADLRPDDDQATM